MLGQQANKHATFREAIMNAAKAPIAALEAPLRPGGGA